MTHMPKEIRTITDKLDAIGTPRQPWAGLAKARRPDGPRPRVGYAQAVQLTKIDLNNPAVTGTFSSAACCPSFSALSIQAVTEQLSL